ncbi:uncharacterized protein METZ01_LOCUS79812 [marine metagenome]|jgi:hypothetical protein|uniref:Rho termination factor-like N-terminal domain-containing protein n=1 Tax=marine metagenome TaxID=408172 RepID=A0A381UH30_9ZZZZ
MARTKQTTREYTQIARIERLEQENVLLNQKVEELTQKFEESMRFIQTLKIMYEMQHPENVSLASTIVDDDEQYTEPEDDLSLDLTMENEIEEKKEIMNQTYNDLDLLSDNEEVEDEEINLLQNQIAVMNLDSELIINENDDEKDDEKEEADSDIPAPPSPTPIQNEAPLPTNLSTSPLPEPMNAEEEEEVAEEEVNYKKMKVGELKKLCKTKGIKGYSKLKKKQLIELLSQ